MRGAAGVRGGAAAASRHPGPGRSAVVCGSPGAPPPLSPWPFGTPSLSPNRGPPPPYSMPPLGPSGSVSSHFCGGDPRAGSTARGPLSFPTVVSDLFLHRFSGVSKSIAPSTQGLLGGIFSVPLVTSCLRPPTLDRSLLSFSVPVPSSPHCLALLGITASGHLCGVIRLFLYFASNLCLPKPLLPWLSSEAQFLPLSLISCQLPLIPFQSLTSISGRSISSTHYSAFP